VRRAADAARGLGCCAASNYLHQPGCRAACAPGIAQAPFGFHGAPLVEGPLCTQHSKTSTLGVGGASHHPTHQWPPALPLPHSVLEYDKELFLKSSAGHQLPTSFQPDLVSGTYQRAEAGAGQPGDPALSSRVSSGAGTVSRMLPCLPPGYLGQSIRWNHHILYWKRATVMPCDLASYTGSWSSN
jgi:hypothetical protein